VIACINKQQFVDDEYIYSCNKVDNILSSESTHMSQKRIVANCDI